MCNDSRGKWREGDCHCEKNLKVHQLCAKCIQTDELCAECITVGELCAGCIKAHSIKAENECVSGILKAKSLLAEDVSANSLCSREGTINTLCVDNLSVNNLAANNLLNFTPYRATVNYSADTLYTLGSFLNFDNIVDDPNGNVSLSPNTTYTAPVSGYYMMTYKVNIDSLLEANGLPILGIPVANPSIYVNGLGVREAFSPFLSFFNTQKVIVDSLITLQAGDKVTMKYDVLADSSGSPVQGTVNIVGAGIEDGNSLFKIILLTALVNNSPVPPQCKVCPLIAVDCEENGNSSDCHSKQAPVLPQALAPAAPKAAGRSRPNWVKPR